MTVTPVLTLALSIALSAVPVAAAAETAAYSIEGAVVNRNGEPIRGATIEVEGRRVASTEGDGRFSFELGSGEWDALLESDSDYRELH